MSKTELDQPAPLFRHGLIREQELLNQMSDQKPTTMETLPQLMLESQLCFPLYAVSRQIVNAYTPYLRPLGLTYTQYIVFLCLWEYGETTVGDLCRRLYLDNGTITPMIKRMEQDGYVRRVCCREDKRVVYIQLTEKGWNLREQVQELPAKVGQCVSLSPEKSMALYQLLYELLEGKQEK